MSTRIYQQDGTTLTYIERNPGEPDKILNVFETSDFPEHIFEQLVMLGLKAKLGSSPVRAAKVYKQLKAGQWITTRS